ncbi:CDP-alcohol phosphatidyltransferase family protein [Sinorhizobium chiapasense]|uniref:CDP-alcohol phosphatidyltransferase family protein n=1 Tax=Sinorhizobium chiapasense TaxID=501572 RepID=A0ABZ2BJ24_9HYPH
MLRHLLDPANAITAAGIFFSSFAVYLALAGRTEVAVAVALWAMLADHLDGAVAIRIVNRPPEKAKMGKSLDGFADIIYGAVFPVVCIITASNASLLSLLTGTALLLAGAIRLSYFSNFGLSEDNKFTGLPLSYDVPLLAVLFLIKSALGGQFNTILNILFLVMSVFHVSSIQIPAPGKLMYVAILVFSVAASASLVAGALA